MTTEALARLIAHHTAGRAAALVAMIEREVAAEPVTTVGGRE
jgi:hypothetical protein